MDKKILRHTHKKMLKHLKLLTIMRTNIHSNKSYNFLFPLSGIYVENKKIRIHDFKEKSIKNYVIFYCTHTTEFGIYFVNRNLFRK